MNGLSALLSIMARDPFKAPGTFTSGRRTPQGNKLVGGVANSKHLTGEAADFTGTTPEALRAYFGQGIKIIPESDHLHAQGFEPGSIPFHGKRGTAGLGENMRSPYYSPAEMSDAERAARAAAFNVKIPGAPSQGVAIGALGGAMLPADVQQEMPQALMQAQATEATKKKHSGLFPGSDMGAIAGILGDALMAYGGLQPSFAPMMADKNAMEREQELALERERIRAMQPPSWLQDAEVFNSLPTEQKAIVSQFMDMRSPIVADEQDAQGRVIRRQIPRTVAPAPGTVEDGYIFMGGDPANKNSWRPL